MKPHNLVLSFIGACLLWVGWFGFNAGSALAAIGLATSAFVATHFGAAAAALGWIAAEWMHSGQAQRARRHLRLRGRTGRDHAGFGFREADARPAHRSVRPGVVCYLMVTMVKSKFGYDDSLDAFGVHGAGGTLGAILTGVFATSAVNDGLKDAAGTRCRSAWWTATPDRC